MDVTLLGLNAEKFFKEYVYIKDSDRNKHMASTGQTGSLGPTSPKQEARHTLAGVTGEAWALTDFGRW